MRLLLVLLLSLSVSAQPLDVTTTRDPPPPEWTAVGELGAGQVFESSTRIVYVVTTPPLSPSNKDQILNGVPDQLPRRPDVVYTVSTQDWTLQLFKPSEPARPLTSRLHVRIPSE